MTRSDSDHPTRTRATGPSSKNEFTLRYGQKVCAPDRSEAQRLTALESMADPATISVLDRIGVQADYQCLEIGAGAGSIARNLADRVPAGGVIATDIVTERLETSRR